MPEICQLRSTYKAKVYNPLPPLELGRATDRTGMLLCTALQAALMSPQKSKKQLAAQPQQPAFNAAAWAALLAGAHIALASHNAWGIRHTTCSPSLTKMSVKLQIEKKKRPIHPDILQNQVLSSRLKAIDVAFVPQRAPR